MPPAAKLLRAPLFAHSVGLGYLGALGLGGFSPAPRPRPLPALRSTPMQCADAGWGHSAFLSAAGDAFVVGLPGDFKNTLRHINMHGAHPLLQRLVCAASGALFPRDWQPRQLQPPHGGAGGPSWVHVACSPGGGTALLDSDGGLHVLGGNTFGQCGQRVASAAVVEHEPRHVADGWGGAGERVVGVSLGLEHALAVTESGGCFAWGRGDRGQLGTGGREHYSAPVRLLSTACGGDWLEGAARVEAVEAGMSGSFAIDEKGGLWAWGKMQGLGEEKKARLGGGAGW